jgi:hypothetical protein
MDHEAHQGTANSGPQGRDTEVMKMQTEYGFPLIGQWTVFEPIAASWDKYHESMARVMAGKTGGPKDDMFKGRHA